MSSEELLFQSYYAKYIDKIYNFVWYRVKNNTSVAEDLTSEIFLKAFTKFYTFDHQKSFQAWIYKIARNHIFNYYRTTDREVDMNQGGEFFVDCKKVMDNVIDAQIVIDNFNELSLKYQEILSLRYVDYLSNKEIAEVLSITEGAVKARICRALKQLRENINI